MSTEDFARAAGETGLAKDENVNNIYQLIALVLAKYGIIGLVCGYFGWINWQQHEQIVSMTQRTVVAAAEQTEAVRALTKAIDRIDGTRRP